MNHILTNRTIFNGKVVSKGIEPATQSFKVLKCGDDLNDYEHLIQNTINHYPTKTMFTDIYKSMKDKPGSKLNIFIHGFANTFEKSIKMADKIRELYPSDHFILQSWSSIGRLINAYHNDSQDAKRTGANLAQIFNRMVTYLIEERADCLGEINLFCHSMGNQVLEAMLKNIDEDKKVKVFKNIVMLHPDVDEDVFDRSYMRDINRIARKTIVVINESDEVTGIVSKYTKNYGKGRLGNGSTTDVLPRGVEILDTTPFTDSSTVKDDLLDHWTAMRSPTAVAEIRKAMR
jgi:esterase/lipase superfamily enzyme